MTSVDNIININIKSYFNDFVSFVSQYQQTIVDYYTSEKTYPKEAFDSLFRLTVARDRIYETISSQRDLFNEFKYFDIVDALEDSFHTIDIFQNYSRWLRSSAVNGKFKNSAEVNIILKQNQTLEGLSGEFGFVNQDEGALDIALRNNIKEKDYSRENQNLVFNFGYKNQNYLFLNSIVDNLTGENILGKDIQKKLEFSVDDLKTLSPKDTFQQTCDILLNLCRRDNPEFPQVGFDKSFLVNRNVLSSTLPSFIRQLYSITSSDDSIASFQVTKMDLNSDALSVEITFKSRIGNEIKQYSNGN